MQTYTELDHLLPFRRLFSYLQKETNDRYIELVNTFLCDIWAILDQEERCRLNQQVTPALLKSLFTNIRIRVIPHQKIVPTIKPRVTSSPSAPSGPPGSLAARVNPATEGSAESLSSEFAGVEGADSEMESSRMENTMMHLQTPTIIKRDAEGGESPDDGQAMETPSSDSEKMRKRCLARTSLGRQCTRTRQRIGKKRSSQLYHDLCASHMKCNPYGIMGGTNPQDEKKQRREFLKKLQKGTKGLDLDEYIRTTEIEFEGAKYLLDEYGVFYQPHDLIIVGKVHDGKIWWYR